MNIEFRSKTMALPLIAVLFIILAIVIQFHNYILSGNIFDFGQIHHETISAMLVMASVVVLILWIDFSSNKRKRALKETKPMSSYRFILLIIGAYIILDGFGSILIYQQQPLFPDHFVRIIRMIVGGIIICIGENLGRN